MRGRGEREGGAYEMEEKGRERTLERGMEGERQREEKMAWRKGREEATGRG